MIAFVEGLALRIAILAVVVLDAHIAAVLWNL